MNFKENKLLFRTLLFATIHESGGHLCLRVLLKSISTERLSKTLAKQDWVWLLETVKDKLFAFLSKQAGLPFSSDIVEAMVAAKDLSFAQDLGFTSFLLEGDSENVIKALKLDEVSLSSFDHLIALAKSTMLACSCISFSHVHRAGNSVAHNLVKHVRHVRVFSVWMEDVLPHLFSVLFANYD